MARPRSITSHTPYTPHRGRLAGQTFTSQRAYESALAKVRGFASATARQQRPVRVGLHTRLGKTASQARGRALEALGLMRRDKLSLREATRRVETTPGVVRRYTGSVLRKGAGGRFEARVQDRLLRRMTVFTTQGPLALDLQDNRSASLAAKHANAVKRFLVTGRTEQLRQYQGRTVRAGKVTYSLEADWRRLNQLGDAGELSFESIYPDAA